MLIPRLLVKDIRTCDFYMIKDTNPQQYTISTYNNGLDSWTSPRYHGPGDHRVAPLLDLTAKRPSLFRREMFGDWMLAESHYRYSS